MLSVRYQPGFQGPTMGSVSPQSQHYIGCLTLLLKAKKKTSRTQKNSCSGPSSLQHRSRQTPAIVRRHWPVLTAANPLATQASSSSRGAWARNSGSFVVPALALCFRARENRRFVGWAWFVADVADVTRCFENDPLRARHMIGPWGFAALPLRELVRPPC
jgi:hypothetical protein